MQGIITQNIIKQSMLRATVARSFYAVPFRMVGDTKKLNDKEKGDEKIFFNKQDGKFYTSISFEIHTTIIILKLNLFCRAGTEELDEKDDCCVQELEEVSRGGRREQR